MVAGSIPAAPTNRRESSVRDLRLRRTGERLGRSRPRPLAWSLSTLSLPRRAPPPCGYSGDFARRDRGGHQPDSESTSIPTNKPTPVVVMPALNEPGMLIFGLLLLVRRR